MIQVQFPLRPLSTNAAYRGRRFKSKAYLQFEKDLLNLVARPQKTLTGPLSVTIEAYLKNAKSSDADNLSKVACDCLTAMGFWKDDRQIQELHLYKYQSRDERTVITITEL